MGIHIRYRGLWAQQNLAADAYLLVYDITNHDSLVALDYFNDIIEMESEEKQMQPGAVPHVKIVAGNKCDLANSRQVSSQEGLAWARGHDCGCVSDLSICFVLGGVVFEGGDHCWPPCGCGVLEGSFLTSLDPNWGERRGTANYQYYCYCVLVKYVWLIFWSAIGSWRHQPVTSSMSRKLSLVSTPHFYNGFRFTTYSMSRTPVRLYYTIPII